MMLRRFGSTSVARVAAATCFTQVAWQSRRGGAPPGGRANIPPEVLAQQQAAGRMPQAEMPQQDMTPPPPPSKPEAPPKFLTFNHAENGVVTIGMKNAPVNSMSLEFFNEMNQWLLWLGSDEATKAVIITSELPMVYSAGLDINELHKPEAQRFGEFWTQFQENWMMLNTFPKPVIAAVNGNSPAGGCILALCADYRVMAKSPAGKPDKPYRIGLNETKLGIIAPPWVMASFTYVIGQRKAERMLQLGETPTAEEALNIGLVDEVVEEENIAAAAMKAAEKFAAIPSEARWMSKDMMRRELFQFMSTEEERRYDTEFFTQMIQNPEVAKRVGDYLQRLGGKKK